MKKYLINILHNIGFYLKSEVDELLKEQKVKHQEHINEVNRYYKKRQYNKSNYKAVKAN